MHCVKQINKKIMKKYLVNIEFKYNSKREYSHGGNMYIEKTVTIGVFDTFDEACVEGNKTLELLETKFALNVYADGRTANKERFSKNGGAFGHPKTLIANLGYLKTPFDFYAKITTLDFEDVNESLTNVLNDIK